jgi:hypothetical protein
MLHCRNVLKAVPTSLGFHFRQASLELHGLTVGYRLPGLFGITRPGVERRTIYFGDNKVNRRLRASAHVRVGGWYCLKTSAQDGLP